MPAKRWQRRCTWLAAGALGALLAGIVLLNLWPQEPVPPRVGQVSAVNSPQFQREASALLAAPLSGGNAVTALQNGDQVFPAMLAAMAAAQRSISLETYIFKSGKVAEQFVATLTERARAGVMVHVLVDWLGSRDLPRELIERLQTGGVHFAYFHPLHWYTLDRVNHRTHRKLLVVDGQLAFIGGSDIADAWQGDGLQASRWRDMQFRVQGPAAAGMQATFADNWRITTGEILLGPDYFPMIPASGHLPVQAVAGGPTRDTNNMQRLYLLAIKGARRSIDLEAAYFVPDGLLGKALLDAMQRGVHLRLVVPGPYVDSRTVLAASRASWGTFLRAGARIYRYQPALFHNKLMVVDGYLTMVGSANFDNRSFTLNDEANINIYDDAFAAHMTRVIDADIQHSRDLGLQEWRGRPWWQRVLDWCAAQGAAQL